MTVRLLVPYGKYPKNANLTTATATEDMLLRTGQADTNTAAGTTYVDPVPTERSGPPAVESTGGVDVLRADGRELLDLSAAQALVSGAVNELVEEYEAAGQPTFARTYTWASLPAAADYIGTAHITDVGVHGSLWRSDGATWGIVGGSCVLYVLNTAGTALTGTTALTAMASIPIAAGLLGLNGALEAEVKFSHNSSAGNKTVSCSIGATGFGGVTSTTSLSTGARWNIQNRNSAAVQIGSNGTTHGLAANAGAWLTGTENTAVAKNFVVNAQLGSGADSVTIEAIRLILVRP
jgi:hypothetical protein